MELSGDARGERQVTSDTHCERQGGSKPLPSSEKSLKKVTITHSHEMHPIVGSKRSHSEASGSLRASKAAKVSNAKQLQNKSSTVGRKIPPIVSGSPMINMLARKRAQLHARSPNSTRTLKSPTLLDLSPTPTHAIPTSMNDVSPSAPTHGSNRRPRRYKVRTLRNLMNNQEI